MLTRRQWKKFCCDDNLKYDLSNPFVIDGWKYATDGRVTVREPTTARNTKGRQLPSAEIMAVLFSEDFQRRKDFTRILSERNKDIQKFCGYWPSVVLDGRVFDSKYLVMIHAIGSVKYKPGSDGRHKIAFRTGDVEVLLAALNSDDLDMAKLQDWKQPKER